MSQDAVQGFQLYPMAELLSGYNAIQGQIDALNASIAEKVAKRKARLDELKNEIRRRMNEQGEQSLSAGGLTVYWSPKTQVSCGDWNKFYGHLMARLQAGDRPDNVFSAFQKRLKVEYVEQWRTDHNDEPPPAVNITIERDIVIRKAA
jgi:hypothetical protein